MPLGNSDVQVLFLLAKNRSTKGARELFTELKGSLSPNAQQIARKILSSPGPAKKNSKALVDVIIERADTRRMDHSSRSFVHAG
jgi:hypothetical protein